MADDDQGSEVAEERVERRAHLLPAEKQAGSDDPESQARAILEDSDRRTADRRAAPGSVVEHRTSDEVVEPTEDR